MTDRRRRLRWIVGVTLALLLAEGGARIAEAYGPPALRWYDASTQIRIEEMDRMDADVVFAGTSMAWQAFDPAQFTALSGRSAYNAGLAGGVPTVMEPWLTEQVAPRLQPTTVVWGLSTLDFSPSFGIENLERYEDALETRNGFLADLERTTSVSALVRYRAVLRDPRNLIGEGRDAIVDDFALARRTIGDGGVRQDYDSQTGEERAAVLRARLAGYTIDAADVSAVVRTVDTLRSQGIDVVFAELPLPARTTRLHPGGAEDLARGHAAIVALADRLEVPVIDLRLGFADSEFVDFTHLGPSGVAQATGALVEVLYGSDTPPAPPPDPETIARLAGRSAQVNDSAFGLIMGRNRSSATEFWYFAQHYGRYRDLSRLTDAGEEVPVVFVGSSLTVNGVMPSVFTKIDGRRSFNAAIPSTEPAMLRAWSNDIAEVIDPDVIVYGVSTWLFRDPTPETPGCELTPQWAQAAALRPQAFAQLPGGAPSIPERLLVDNSEYVGALDAVYDNVFREDGERRAWRQNSAASIDRAFGRLEIQAQEFVMCDDYVREFIATIDDLVAAGKTVVLVGMPTSNRVMSAFPGGREQSDGLLRPVIDDALAHGAATFLDLGDVVPLDQFRDLRHVGEDGARMVTRLVAEHLGELGL